MILTFELQVWHDQMGAPVACAWGTDHLFYRSDLSWNWALVSMTEFTGQALENHVRVNLIKPSIQKTWIDQPGPPQAGLRWSDWLCGFSRGHSWSEWSIYELINGSQVKKLRWTVTEIFTRIVNSSNRDSFSTLRTAAEKWALCTSKLFIWWASGVSIWISEEWSRDLVLLQKAWSLSLSSTEAERKSMNSSSDGAIALTKGTKFSQMHSACWSEKTWGFGCSVCACEDGRVKLGVRVCVREWETFWGPEYAFYQQIWDFFGIWGYFGWSSRFQRAVWGLRIRFRVQVRLRLPFR